MECQFTDPKQLIKNEGLPVDLVDIYDENLPFSFSKMSCTDNKYEEIVDPNGKTIILNKSMSFGEGLISFFLLGIIIFLVADWLFHIILKRN